MTLLHPQALWLLAALPAVWLLAIVSRRDHARRRLLIGAVLRTIVLLLVVLAIAQPRVRDRDGAIAVVYAIDISSSVAPASVARALSWIRDANARYRPAEARYLAFADRARFVGSLDDVSKIAVVSGDRSSDPQTIAQGATDIEQALRAAAAAFGPRAEHRVVLFSDGVQTRGDLWRSLSRLQAANVRVFTYPSQVAVERDAWVDGIAVPDGVRLHEPVVVEVAVHASVPMPARVDLAAGAKRLASRSLKLQAGTNAIAFEVEMPQAGAATLTATVHAEGDTLPDNDTLAQSVWVGPRPRVLYVEGIPESAHYLADALRAHHIDVTVERPEALAANPPDLAAFDVVVLSDVFVQSIDARLAAALEAFVRDRGGGLVFAAGESSYGEQGFAGSPVERLLPVRFEGKRQRRDLDLVLLIDRSHSMRGRKLEMAKTAALSTLDLLEDRHRLAVVAFDVKPHEVVPLAPVGNKRKAEDLISSMTARGQTSIHPALLEAQRLLASSTAATKHIILLSDGVTLQPPSAGSGPSAEEIQALVMKGREDTMREQGIPIPAREAADPVPPPGAIEEVVAELAKSKVTVSTIAIGDKPNLGLMRDIAALGNGRAHVAHDDAEIPGLFVRETRRLLGASLLEETFRPAVAHEGAVLAGLDFRRGPPLHGMVVARPKAFADVLLRGPGERPLLVTTQYGLGRTMAFLSDAKNRWSREWIGWEGYSRFWAQVVRDAIPRRDDRELSLHVTRSGSEALVEVRALDRVHGYRNGLTPSVQVSDPAGAVSTLALEQVAPGAYAARRGIEPGHAGPYRFELLEGGGITRTDIREAGVAQLYYAWLDELRGLPADVASLRLLSERTGGAFAPKAEDVFALHGDAEPGSKPLWPYLLAAALGVFLLDILNRRMRWPMRPLT